jgi:lipopolysaccharide export system protein LptA
MLGPETVQSARSIEYEDSRDSTARFRILARELIETRQGKNLLQGVEAFDLNPDGSVHNKIRSLKADYDSENRIVDFIGDVRLFLGRDVELRTESLRYDMNADIGTTRDPVRFYSGKITGQAQGLQYDLKAKLLELKSDVDFLIPLEEKSSDGSGSIEEFHAISGKAFWYEEYGRIEFLGNARLESECQLLTGDAIEAEIDADLDEMTSLVSTGNATYHSKAAVESRTLSGDRMLFDIHPGSRKLEKILISGNSAVEFVSASEERKMAGSEIDLYFNPELDLPIRIDGRTGVRLRIIRGAEEAVVSGELFRAVFYPETQALENIDVRQKAKISITGTAGSAGNEINAERVDISLRKDMERSVLESLRAEGSAQWISLPEPESGKTDPSPYGKLDAALIRMFYSEDGEYLDRIDSSGDVVMTEMPPGTEDIRYTRRIFADRARFGFFSAVNKPKDMNAEGHVRIVYEGEPTSDRPETREGFRTESEKMKAAFTPDSKGIVLASASQWGNFKYEDASKSATSGMCVYDAQTEVMILKESPGISFETGSATGETVEYDRKQGVGRVMGKVITKLKGTKEAGLLGGKSTGSDSIVLADAMQYRPESEYARYSGNVHLLYENHHLQSDMLDIISGGERIEATGNIRHLISGDRTSDGESAGEGRPFDPAPKETGNSQDMPIYIKSSKLECIRDKNLLLYSGNITLNYSDLILTSGSLEAILDEEGKEIDRATAKDNVVVHKGNRECKGDVAYYYSDPKRFDVTGAPVKLYDPERGWSFPPRLTYDVTDDRILMEGRKD